MPWIRIRNEDTREETEYGCLCSLCCLSQDRTRRRLYRPLGQVRRSSSFRYDAVRAPTRHHGDEGAPVGGWHPPIPLTRLDPPVTSPLTSPGVITMATLKKSPGSGTPTKKGQLRSPVIKRPLSAPVTLQGWLHKQGSDGLMLWKKRWFVLSEYCLFYYKGSEEEKLLGSILLPSYKISPCSTEDKVYRKFSFKAEHANMRTYYFAADSQQLMAQWMNALSLASILQESTTWEEHRSGLSTVSSQHNASADDSDSGFHGNFRPNTNDNTLECTTPSNGWRGNQFSGYHQPLYANAPPKPRRLNNDTSSPERSPERPSEDSGRMSRMAQPTEYQIRNDRPYHYNAQHSHRPPVLLPTTNQPQLNNAERRTPDTYGRSNSATPQTGKVISSKPRPSDYEDVYQNNPDLIITGNHNPMYVTYSNRNPQVQYRRREPARDIPTSVDGQQQRFPPRPHSADFLEYDAKRYYQSPTPQSSDSGNQGVYYNGQRFVNAQPRRPKSSLDIMQNEVNNVDGNYWSEESYARKMRQSVSYVSPQLHNMSNSSRATTPSVRQIPVMTAHNCYDSTNGELASVKMREHSEAIRLQERRWSEYVDARANRPDQFVRSASARLPRQQRPDDRDDEGSDKSSQSTYKRRNSTDNRDGPNKTQQREESMKRLLEWKQRMLQSPLTRKSSGSSNRGVAQNEVSKYYKAQVLRELANQEARSRNLVNQHQMPPNINVNQWNRIPTNLDGDYWKKESWEVKDHPVPEHRSSRRKHSDESGSRTVRSRSQDGRRSASSLNRYNSYSSDDEASGSGSVIGRDPLPPRQVQPAPIVDKPPPPSRSPTQQPPPPQVNNVIPVTTSPTGNNEVTHKRGDGSWNLQVSAGELLGRTHEELVLLLIQLRRQSAGFCKAMEACHMEIEAQARLTELETPKRLEHLQKLEDLKRHLLELEKQYEKGKPLVNLVDNMVKLGSLYRAGAPIQGSGMPLFRERLEFNHKVQEQRLLAEERKDWDRLSPDHTQLQAKVEQLYRLDRILQEESGTLQSLQQDKEMLERAIGGLRHKLQGIHGNPAEAERYRRQQRLLERELSRVRSILAHNSKKLEETVAENARLEQELVVLRQKLQWSRRVPDSGSGPTTAALEAELRRVQTLVGDLQRQRQELSLQVRQLTEKSHSLSEQIRPGPTGVAGAGPIPGKKSISSSWLETDLDTQLTQDVGLDSPAKSPPQMDPARSQSPSSPLYVNTEESKAMDVSSTYESSISQDEQQELLSAPPTVQQPQYCRPMDISEADDRMKRFYGIIPRDKPQEIKTVRIVKRESERRQRDRDRSGNIGIPLTNTTSAKRVTIIEESFNGDSDRQGLLGRVLEEPPEPPSEVFQGSAPLIRHLGPPPAPGPRSDSAIVLRNLVTRQNRAKLDSESSSPSRSISAHEQLFGSAASLGSVGSEGEGGLSPQLSPVYQSQAARQIVEEIAWRSGGKRLVPREKRRHHTVSGRPLLRIDTSYSASGSRDDLDMERALRPRLNAPDVVRSTLSRTDAKYTSETIDNILGTPGKIIIPERYVPESMPELTSEEQAKRLKKADAIRKMLSETTSNSFQRTEISPVGTEIEEEEKSSTLRKKVAEEKRQREHLLQLNQILAQQVMEKSKMVAGVNSGCSQE